MTEWQGNDRELTWQPKAGVVVTIRFEDNRYSGDEYEPKEELDCYYWQLTISGQDGRELFSESSGDYDWDSDRFMSLARCKNDAINYYNTYLNDAVSGDLSRAREEERNLSEALGILNGITVF